MKGKITTLLLIFILLAGLSLLLYPAVSNFVNSLSHSQIITDYTDQVEELGEAESAKLWEQAVAYNQRLLNRVSQTMLPDEMREDYYRMLLSSGSRVMGFVEIPSIGVKLPIRHGTDETTLAAAIGHLEWSSLPVGGESTHCILSGHRGLPSSELFTNVDHMEIGDHFHLHVLDQKLTYRVDNIAVVEPTDHSLLGITQGKDYVTLVTCTPYGINSHRLLVRGVRVESEQAADGSPALVNNELHTISPTVVIPVVMAVLAAAIFLILLLDSGRKKYKGRRSVRKREEA